MPEEKLSELSYLSALHQDADVPKYYSRHMGCLFDVLTETGFKYDAFLDEINKNNSLSSIPEVEDMRKFEESDEKGFLAFIRRDCELKLQDVRDVNGKASVAAFMSIPALIGFLAKLAFYQNDEFLNRVKASRTREGKPHGIDGKSYVEFVNRFMLGERTSVNYQRMNGVGQVFYKMVRCGLLHGETVGSNAVADVRVALSHDEGKILTLKEIDTALLGRTSLVEVVFNAEVLCDAIEGAIGKMFESGDDNVISSIKTVYKEEPPILFIKKN